MPDTDIDIPIEQLMKLICYLIANANIPDADFKNKITLCEIKVLARFFKNKKLTEMIELLQTLTKNQETERIIKKYGQGFDSIYFDGKTDGYQEGCNDSHLKIAKNCLKTGLDINIISRCTGVSINKLKKLQKEL